MVFTWYVLSQVTSSIRLRKEDLYKGLKALPPQELLKFEPDVILITVMEPEHIEDYFDSVLIPQIGKFKYKLLIQESFLDLLKELKELLPF